MSERWDGKRWQFRPKEDARAEGLELVLFVREEANAAIHPSMRQGPRPVFQCALQIGAAQDPFVDTAVTGLRDMHRSEIIWNGTEQHAQSQRET